MTSVNTGPGAPVGGHWALYDSDQKPAAYKAIKSPTPNPSLATYAARTPARHLAHTFFWLRRMLRRASFAPFDHNAYYIYPAILGTNLRFPRRLAESAWLWSRQGFLGLRGGTVP